MKSLSCVRLYATLWTVACQASPAMGLSRQEYWSGLPCCHFLLQGIFPTQGSNLGPLHCRQTLYRLSHQGILQLARVTSNIYAIQQYDTAESEFIMIKRCTIFHNCPHPAPACSGSISADGHWGGVGIMLGRNTWFCQIKVIIAFLCILNALLR